MTVNSHLGLICYTVLCLLSCTRSAVGQSTAQVVTLVNGAQYIGQVATVPEFSSEMPNPWGAQQIALVDDGLRRILFNVSSVANLSPIADDHPLANPIEFEIPQRTYSGTVGYGSLRIHPFDRFGHRIVESRSSEGLMTFAQGITRITPNWCEVQTLVNTEGSKTRDWTMRIGTTTVPREVLRNLLEHQIRDRDNPAEYLTIVDFFTDMQQYAWSLEELGFIAQRFSDLGDVIAEQQAAIRQAQARQWVRQVNERIDAGQPILGGEMLRAFDRAGIAGEILAEMALIQQRLDDSKNQLERTRKTALEFTGRLRDSAADDSSTPLNSDQLSAIERFEQELNTDLNLENVARLDAFWRLVSDTQLSVTQKVSLALSGWLLGSNEAQENFAITQSLFAVRDLVEEYLTTATLARRQEILQQMAKFEAGDVNYLAPLIAQLKPPAAPDLTGYDPSRPLEFEYEIGGTAADSQPAKFRYFVQLPPEYDPYRRYPCILALPGDSNIEQQILLWCGAFNAKLGTRVGQAMRNGYIVVVVDWKLPGQFAYEYSSREHQAVMTAFRQALRQFSIDTDRVFIAGHYAGADAAYDIGIAHPEHWAGVVGVSGKIDRYPDLYREHEHNRLPVYSVVGEKDLLSKEPSEDAWNRWLPSKRFFETTVVEYRGRGDEVFVEEIIEIFKWANGLRRRLPDRSGFKFEGKLRRPWDNYFWFYELRGFPPENVVWPEFFQIPFPSPVGVLAELKGNQVNRFFVSPANSGDGITIWLSPEFVDFGQKIQVSGRGKLDDFVLPSTEILLEDVRLRSDRQHPYWANVFSRGKQWQANQISE